MQPEKEDSAQTSTKPIKIAILAMGGEGGGVLADWLVDAAEAQGFYAQSTSVPGVAQRTGATIYYVEVLQVQRTPVRHPVLCMMPTPGDVDIVMASELMESSRAVQRGLVTPDKTVLITSSHRVYALPEKMAMGDGRVDDNTLLETGRNAAKAFVAHDFARIAENAGSVISATLFGALAAAGGLPWDRREFEAAIQRGGVGVKASLKAFDAGYRACRESEGKQATDASIPRTKHDVRLKGLMERVHQEFPLAARETIEHGVVRAADYQDVVYACEYLDRLAPIATLDARCGDGSWRLTRETARYLALWMTYEDTARVAELKIRASRFDRVRKEVRVSSAQLITINEYFHPRMQEIADLLPASLGRLLLQASARIPAMTRLTDKGRVIRTSSLSGFLLLYVVASCRAFRRRSLRYAQETRAMNEWLARIEKAAPDGYDYACELVECQRLIKGYGDTHARGMASYEAILAAMDLRPSKSAVSLRNAREAALADESGAALQAALAQQVAAEPASA